MEPYIQPLEDYNHRFVVFVDGWTGGGVLAFLLLLIDVPTSENLERHGHIKYVPKEI